VRRRLLRPEQRAERLRRVRQRVAETGGTIDVVYETATPGTGGGGYVRGNGATVGLQGPAGGVASQFACGQGSNDLYNATPYAVRFTPL
jgi:hypothetical protein